MGRIRTRLATVGILALGLVAVGGTPPVSSAIDRPEVWVSLQDSGKAAVVDTSANPPAITAMFDFNPALGPGSQPHVFTFSNDGRWAFLSFQGASKVAVFDAVSRTLNQVLTVGTAPGPSGPNATPSIGDRTTQAKLSPDQSYLLVTNIGPKRAPGVSDPLAQVIKIPVSGLSTASPTFGAPTSLAFGDEGPTCVSWSKDGTLAYVTLQNTGVRVIDPVGLTKLGFLAVSGDPQCGIHDPVDGHRIIVTSNDSKSTGHVYEIHSYEATITELTPVGGFPAKDLHDNWPARLNQGSAAKPSDKTALFAGARGEDNEVRFDPRTGAVSKLPVHNPTPPAGTPAIQAPDTQDGRGDTVFAAMNKSGELAIIDNFATVSFVNFGVPPITVGGGLAIHGLTVRPGT